MNETFPITPAADGARWIVALEGVLVGVLFAGTLVLAVFASHAWLFGGLAALLAVLGLWMIGTARATSRSRVEVGPQAIRIRGDLCGRRLPRNALRLARACVMDLHEEPRLRPARRTNGVGLPGYQVGWFTLESGQKALCYVTDATRVVYLPTTEGYALLLSVAEADRFLNALRLPPGA